MTNDHWHMLLTTLPGGSGTPRMRVWRALKARGAGIPRDGVYLLPAREGCRAALESQAEQVREAGGSAWVVDVDDTGDPNGGDFRALFDREDEYAAWIASAERLRGSLAGAGEAECRRRTARLRRELEAIVAIDYFPGPDRAAAESLLEELDGAVNRHFSPDEPTATGRTLSRCAPEDFQERRWATRQGLWVDRVASAWLIRRFIDTRAKFLWLADAGECPADAVGFDFDGATFSHVGDRVTFQVLAHGFSLDEDPALARIGELVRYLDVGGAPVPEAAGFVAVLAGAKESLEGDDALLASASALLDHLYTAFAGEAS